MAKSAPLLTVTWKGTEKGKSTPNSNRLTPIVYTLEVLPTAVSANTTGPVVSTFKSLGSSPGLLVSEYSSGLLAELLAMNKWHTTRSSSQGADTKTVQLAPGASDAGHWLASNAAP